MFPEPPKQLEFENHVSYARHLFLAACEPGPAKKDRAKHKFSRSPYSSARYPHSLHAALP